MKPLQVAAADIDFSGEAPRSRRYGDVYHSRSGALAQARHVFVGGNGLPRRWQGARAFRVLEIGFGLAGNFLATWAAWRADPQRCGRLEYVSIEAHPARRQDLARALAVAANAEAAAFDALETEQRPTPDMAESLLHAWPPLTPGLHLLEFDGGRVRLMLAFGDARRVLRQLVGRFDAFFLDGFAPRLNPEAWDPALLRSLGRLAAPGATAATWCLARPVREGLRLAGFEVSDAPGLPPRRRMTVATFSPRHVAATAPGRPDRACSGPRTAVVVGAGLAGAAVAAALASRGWAVTVLDAADAPASGASGNPAALFHGAVHPDDGLHARLHRAGALLTARRVREAIAAGAAGQVQGLLATVAGDAAPQASAAEDYARPLSQQAAAQQAGVPLRGAALLYGDGGWVDPAALVRFWLGQPGITFRGGCRVGGWEVLEGPQERQWTVKDLAGQTIAQAAVLVLATGADLDTGLAPDARVQRVRGQVTWFDGGPGPSLPVSGHGYAVSPQSGRVLCGAASAPEDLDPTVRVQDHRYNLERLQSLTGIAPLEGAPLEGRVAWRCTPDDRLPLIGAVPDTQAAATRGDQVRFLPRQRGLFVVGGFGSRGLTWAPLAGEILAGWLEGTPLPLEADLLDAVDPARWAVRRYRLEGRAQGDRRSERDAPGPVDGDG